MAQPRYRLQVTRPGIPAQPLDISADSPAAAQRAAESMGWTVLGVAEPHPSARSQDATLNSLRDELDLAHQKLDRILNSAAIAHPIRSVILGLLLWTVIIFVLGLLLGSCDRFT